MKVCAYFGKVGHSADRREGARERGEGENVRDTIVAYVCEQEEE